MAPPPSVEALVDAPHRYPEVTDAWEARFLLMQERWTEQTQELGTCNRRLGQLREWFRRQHDVEVD